MKRRALVSLFLALSALSQLPGTEGYCDSSRTNEFGPQCEYTCHCIYQLKSRCGEDGTCKHNQCQDGYFGTRCQYRNIAAGLTNLRFIDYNVDTCNLNRISEASVYAETTPFNFTWLRVSGEWGNIWAGYFQTPSYLLFTFSSSIAVKRRGKMQFLKMVDQFRSSFICDIILFSQSFLDTFNPPVAWPSFSFVA
ncbi:uncharacterized protein LOC106011619 [Aplysia californica]|uniref:Uncharacterized protein LOC106011619 n=1 Tax=Aplysia californica TaxID=6500 RepID=A0ABM0ZYS3_APLCA|nr:uncharacterized protein LOC106011619 [Aplysia californica]